jgi:hypothetical protein
MAITHYFNHIEEDGTGPMERASVNGYESEAV